MIVGYQQVQPEVATCAYGDHCMNSQEMTFYNSLSDVITLHVVEFRVVEHCPRELFLIHMPQGQLCIQTELFKCSSGYGRTSK